MVGRRTAKDFCLYWARQYRRVVGKKYVINWVGDGSVFRNLISDFTNVEIKALIDFAFSNDPSTRYLASQGYPVRLFASQVNKFNTKIQNPGFDFDYNELELNIPVWEDGRTSYIYRCVMEGDLQSIVENVENEYYWQILIEKMNRQNLGTKKVLIFYDMWRSGDSFERTRIKRRKR